MVLCELLLHFCSVLELSRCQERVMQFYVKHSLDLATQSMTATATPTATPIPAEAYGSICGLAIASSGETSIVVAGGDFGSVLVYIYDLTEETWREALNPLPFDLWLSSVVPFGDTFLAVGGLRADGQRDDRILEYQPDDESWMVREERLSEPKSEMSVLFISEDKVSCS